MKSTKIHIDDLELKEKLEAEKHNHGFKTVLSFVRFIIWDWFKIQSKNG